MLNVFIINPMAGNRKTNIELVPQIEAYFSSNGGRYALEYTKCKGDGARIANEYAASGEQVRLYACGGDGTLHEVVNGAFGYENVEIGSIPSGTGNDYVSSFGKKSDFLNIEGQVKGSSVEVDLIECDGVYAINQCSMGFDSAVCSNKEKLQNKKIIGGKAAYISAIVKTLASNYICELTITYDDVETVSGKFLFATAAKGKFQGNGLKNAPDADPQNRKLNFVTVRAVGIPRFISLFPKYVKGEHITETTIVSNKFGEKLRIRAEKPLPVNFDGEVIYKSELTANIVKRGAKFIIPSVITAKRSERIKRAAGVK